MQHGGGPQRDRCLWRGSTDGFGPAHGGWSWWQPAGALASGGGAYHRGASCHASSMMARPSAQRHDLVVLRDAA